MSLLHYCCKAGAPGIGWYWQRDVAWTQCLHRSWHPFGASPLIPPVPAHFKHYYDGTSVSRTNKLSVTNTLIPVCLLRCYRRCRDSSQLCSPSPHPGSWSQPSLPLDKHEGPALCGLLWCAAAHSGGVTGLSARRWDDGCGVAAAVAVVVGRPCSLQRATVSASVSSCSGDLMPQWLSAPR